MAAQPVLNSPQHWLEAAIAAGSVLPAVAHVDQAIVLTTGTTTTTPYGFATAAQGDNLVKTVNAIRLALINLGLIKGSA